MNEGGDVRTKLTYNIRHIMTDILKDCAVILVRQKIETNSGVDYFAAPCFEFYPETGGPLDPETLFNSIDGELKAAKDVASDQDTKAKIQAILDSLQGVSPPSN